MALFASLLYAAYPRKFFSLAGEEAFLVVLLLLWWYYCQALALVGCSGPRGEEGGT